MRILLIGPHFLGKWTESSRAALQALGHHVYTVYYAQSPNEFRIMRAMAMTAVWSQAHRGAIHAALSKLWLSRRHRSLNNIARDFSPQLIIVLKGETIPLNVLGGLRCHLKVPIVTWWVDDPFRFPDIVETYSLYDRFFIFDRAYVPQLEAAGVRRVTFLPCACDPEIYHPVVISERDRRRYQCDIAFVAAFYPPREQLVERMAGLDVAIWGPGWKLREALPAMRSVGDDALRGKRLDSRRAARLYNVAKVCVNTHAAQSVFDGLNTRTFEVLACGAFGLVDWLPGMHDLLAPGKEVICYESYDQARELADYYLARPEARVEIGRNGRVRVLKEHTYRHRMKKMLMAVNDLL